MSRARFRFLRMLLPSGNSRVSVTLNSLIRALFRRGFFPRALSQGLLPCAISRRLFLCTLSQGLFPWPLLPGLFPCTFLKGLFPSAVSQGLFRCAHSNCFLTDRIVWMNWYVRCLFFEFFLNYCESSRSILSKCKRKSTYQRLSQLKLKSSKKRPEAWHRIKSYQKRIIRFNHILLQFFLHNCLENQIPFKHMTNMSMIKTKRSLR